MSEPFYVMGILLSSGLALAVVTWMWSHDLDAAGRVFTAMLGCYPLVGAFVVGELVASTRELSVVFYNLHSAVVVLIVPLWFLFTVVYTDRIGWLTRPRLVAAGGVVGGLVLLQASNPLHGLVYSEYEFVTAPFVYVEGVPSPATGAIAALQGVSYIGGMALLGYHYLFETGARRKQTVTLIVGFLPVMAVVGVWQAGLLPGPVDGANNIAGAWTLAFVALAVFRYQLFDVRSLARKRVFEDLRDPLIVLDEERRVVDANDAAVETFPELSNASGESVDDRLPEIVDGNGSFVPEFARYDDESREFDVTVSPLTTVAGTHGHSLVVHDVTATRRQIRDLEQQSAQLERFASTLSHDLRNPLTVADGYAELAYESGDVSHLESTLDAHERMAQIIDDVLTLSREGRTIDEPERVDLGRVVRNAWSSTETGRATLVVEPDADVTVYADRTRLQSVFENLFRNAVEHGIPVDAGESGEHPNLTVRVGRLGDGFYVEDDGPGVPPAEREQVFEYEYTTNEKGTGLGLAIVEAIAQAHGWSVTMTEGTTGGARLEFSEVDVVDDLPGTPSTQTD
ncbi:ATP-binding protein [Halobacteria archaeon HArc-gm2]|nr:ATP-binding protein [Halobacteria archaeon HArc-gm2]